MHIVQYLTDPGKSGEKWRDAQTFTGATQYSEAHAYARSLLHETGMKIRIVEILIKDVFDPHPKVDPLNTDDRRQHGEQIYLDGTDMQVGDLVEIWPSTEKFDRPKRWIRAQGWITLLRDVRVVIRSTDLEVCDFHPADLSLIGRKED